MNLLHMALRNLGRNRARSVLSLLAVAVGVFVVVLSKGFVDGFINDFVENTVTFNSGHVRVLDEEYRVKERLLSLNYPVDGFEGEGYKGMVEAFAAIDGVELVVPRLRFGAMISKESGTKGIMAMGVDPTAEDRLVGFSRYLKEGRFIQRGQRETVIGRQLLNELGLDVGDKFTLIFNTALGSLKGYTLQVAGALESGLPYLDNGIIFVPLDVVQDMLNMQGSVTDLLLIAAQRGKTAQIVQQVRAVLSRNGAADRYAAVPWYEYSDMVRTITLAQVIYNGVYLFILILASFAVVNTMVMIVNERRREIGILSALGLGPRQILLSFLLEGGVLGVGGSLIGVVLGGIIVKIVSVVGVPMGAYAEEMDQQFMIPTRLYPGFSLEVLVFAFVAGIAITLLAVFWPARRAARMDPTQALRR